MAIRFTRGWLAVLLTKNALFHRYHYVGRHKPIIVELDQVEQTYHPKATNLIFPIQHPELWLARLDDRDEAVYLSAALMRAPINKVHEYTNTHETEYVIRWDFSALWTVVDYLKADRLSNWGWLKFNTAEWPDIWSRELEIISGKQLMPV